MRTFGHKLVTIKVQFSVHPSAIAKTKLPFSMALLQRRNRMMYVTSRFHQNLTIDKPLFCFDKQTNLNSSPTRSLTNNEKEIKQ